MIWSLRFKKNVLVLKMLLWILCLWFCLKLYPVQVVISVPLWIKLAMGQFLLLIFLCNFCSLFSYAGGALLANLSPLLWTIFPFLIIMFTYPSSCILPSFSQNASRLLLPKKLWKCASTIFLFSKCKRKVVLLVIIFTTLEIFKNLRQKGKELYILV